MERPTRWKAQTPLPPSSSRSARLTPSRTRPGPSVGKARAEELPHQGEDRRDQRRDRRSCRQDRNWARQRPQDLVRPVVGLADRSGGAALGAGNRSGRGLGPDRGGRQGAPGRRFGAPGRRRPPERTQEEQGRARTEPRARAPPSATRTRLARSLARDRAGHRRPGRPATGASEVEELTRLQREKAIRDRLDSYKGNRG